jgi:riboflavin kinase/FMN adenylyltransferase
VEAHLLDFGGDLRGQRLGLHFLARLRGQVRFAGPEALVAQLRRDVEATRRLSENLSQLTDNPPIAV